MQREDVGMKEGERKVEICALLYFYLFIFFSILDFHVFDHVTEKNKKLKRWDFNLKKEDNDFPHSTTYRKQQQLIASILRLCRL